LLCFFPVPTAVEARGLGGAVARARQITRFLPPCLLVPHVAALWRGPLGPGEVLATVASTSLATLLEEVGGSWGRVCWCGLGELMFLVRAWA
jgi:hypothetical protein